MFTLRKILLIFFLLLSTASLLACAKENTSIEDKQPITATTEITTLESVNDESIRIIETLMLTPEEKTYIKALQEKGTLSIATTVTKGTYEVIDGNVKGYSHGIASKFAEDLSVSLDVKVIHDFEDFFEYNGVFSSTVFTDTSIEYTPDLFEEVDIYIDLLTPIPWRERLMHIIKVLPIREVIVHSKDTRIGAFEDLDGLTVAISPVTSFYTTLQETAIKQHISLNYIFTNTVTESLEAINKGQADFTVMDSNLAFLEVDSNPSLQVGLPITPINHLGWAVKKDDQVLASILEKYWSALKTSGDFNQLWLKDYQANYFDYYRFITNNLSAMETIQFTPEEQTYLKSLQDKGVLKIASSESKTSFNFVNNEHKGYYYLLIKNFTDSLGIELDTTIVEEFTMYFWKDGQTPKEVKSDPTYTYTPDLLKEIDVYVENLTILPWRQQIFNQIPIVPAKPVFVLHKDSDIHQIEDLDGKTVAINRDTVFEMVIEELSAQHNLTIHSFDITSDRQGYDAVESGRVDATMIDSDLGLLILQDYDDLVISFSASEISDIGWAVKKEDEILASILSKYIEATKQNGKFEEYWNETYDISYIEYLRLLTD